ncbi:MAG: LDCC motif putative metal-binding protein, partial [Bacteroidota bacterium]
EDLTLSYNPYSVSDTCLSEELKLMGYLPVEEAKKKKGIVARWIDKMARDNQENLGNQRLDCWKCKHLLNQ